MGYIMILNETDYKKKERALRRYFTKSYKELIFDVVPKIKKQGKKDGLYKYELVTEELFKKVYGPLELQFTIKNDKAYIEDLLPSELLMEGFYRDLPIYKGIPYRNKNDLKKIKMMEAILCQSGKKNLK